MKYGNGLSVGLGLVLALALALGLRNPCLDFIDTVSLHSSRRPQTKWLYCRQYLNCPESHNHAQRPLTNSLCLFIDSFRSAPRRRHVFLATLWRLSLPPPLCAIAFSMVHKNIFREQCVHRTK